MSGSDRGLQAERTRLAWRRTLLAMTVGALLGLRLLPPVLGAAGVVIALVALVLTVGAAAVARRRGARITRVLHGAAPPEALPGGGLLLGVALFVAGGAALAAVIDLHR